MSGSEGRRAGSVIDAELAYGRSLLGAHAAPLFAIASLLVDDEDVAAQVLVDVIADASPDASMGADAPQMRALLAGRVYRSCVDLISSRNRATGSPSPARAFGAAAVLARLSFGHRAVVGLVLIGGQDLASAAETLGMSRRTILTDLLEAIEAIRANMAPRPLPRPLHPDRRDERAGP